MIYWLGKKFRFVRVLYYKWTGHWKWGLYSFINSGDIPPAKPYTREEYYRLRTEKRLKHNEEAAKAEAFWLFGEDHGQTSI